MRKILPIIFSIILFTAAAFSQPAEVTISLNEQFFDRLFDAVFTKLKNPTFQISSEKKGGGEFKKVSYAASEPCKQSVSLQREVGGVYSAVRFRQGKIYAPLAFTGKYEIPLIGCIEFSGWAETDIVLEFDQGKQALFGRVKAENVQLARVPALANKLVSKFVQSEIDKKINPVEILKTDKISFLLPIQSADGSLQMKAIGLRNEIGNGFLNVIISYEFNKA